MSTPSIDDLIKQSGKQLSSDENKKRRVKKLVYAFLGILCFSCMLFLLSKIDGCNQIGNGEILNDVDGVQITTPIKANQKEMLKQKLSRFKSMLADAKRKNLEEGAYDLTLKNCFGDSFNLETIELIENNESSIINLTSFIKEIDNYTSYSLKEINWRYVVQESDTFIYMSNLKFEKDIK